VKSKTKQQVLKPIYRHCDAHELCRVSFGTGPLPMQQIHEALVSLFQVGTGSDAFGNIGHRICNEKLFSLTQHLFSRFS
jgi:hypothetical protein